MKMRIFIIKNDFIVFQSILQHALKPLIKALFPLRLSPIQNMVFKCINSIFWRRQSLCVVNSWYAGRKRSHWVPSTADKPSIWRFGRPKRRWLEPICESSHWCMVNNESSSLVRCGVPLRIDRPIMLKWNTSHMTSFAEKQDTVRFEVFFPQTTTVGFG